MRDTNPNKKGTCKCVDYFHKDKHLFVKQKKREDGFNLETKCNKKTAHNSDFCEEHKHCKKFFKKFTNGNEPKYQPKKWAEPYVESSHNCYTYFLDDIMGKLKKKCEKICEKKHKGECPRKTQGCRKLIPQPGDHDLILNSGNLNNKTFEYTCKEMEDKIMRDNPTLIKTELTNKCKKGYYRGAMVADPGNTFHFYRQNPDGTWSHKPGTLPVTNTDADNKIIYAPHTANGDYTKPNDNDPINYTAFCGYYCIPTNNNMKTNAE